MSVNDRLREHIIGLLDAANEEALANAIRVLERETGRNSGMSPSDFMLGHGMAESMAVDDDTASVDAKMPDVTSNLFGSQPNTARGAKSAEDGHKATGPGSAAPAVDGEEKNGEGEGLHRSQRAGTHRRAGVRDAPVIIEDARNFEPRVIEKSPAEIEELMKVVDNNPLFASLERRDKEKIVMALDRQEVDAGTNILAEGETSPSRFYLIFDGTVCVIKNGKNVASMSRGQTFGELEMMYDTNEPNAATVRSVTDVFLWWLDRPTYKNVVLRATLEKRELYLSLLNKVAFLEGMTEYDKNTLADALSVGNYRNGDSIIKFGEKGNWMHFIVEGFVQVVGRDKGKKVDIVRLGPGECVGELEFLFNHLTVADVIASGPVVTAKMNRKHFEMCMGPITNDLKRHVAKGNYEHYLKEAGSSVLDEISAVEKKAARKTAAPGAGGALLANFDLGGELLVAKPLKKDDSSDKGPEAPEISRFPLRGIDSVLRPCLVLLREDGTILSWSDEMAKLTKYEARDVVGQSVYSYLTSLRDQTEMHHNIARATKFAGDADSFYAEVARRNAAAAKGEKEAGEDGEERTVKPIQDLFTFSRADGLTKSTIQITVLPPVASAAAGQAESVLIVGVEKKRAPLQKDVDPAEWIVERVKEEINALNAAATDPVSARGEKPNPLAEEKMASVTVATDPVSVAGRLRNLIAKFEELQQRAAGEQNLHAVNIRQLVGQVVSGCQETAIANSNTIDVTYSDQLPDELYVDTGVVPDVIKYGLAKSAKHATGAAIKVAADIITDGGLEYFEVAVHDNISTIDSRVLNAFKKACGGNAPQWFANNSMDKVRQAVSKLGGQMRLTSSKTAGTIFQFRFPFIAPEPAADLEDSADVDLSVSARKPARMTFTTLVVEERPVHRNALNASLWERKHAVMPANTGADVLRLAPACDIIVADPQQATLTNGGAIADPIAFLRSQVRNKAVIITGESFDEDTRNAYHQAGFFTLTKPFTAVQATAVFRKAEDIVAKYKADESKIEAMRNVFTGNGRSAERAPWEKGRLLGKGAFGEVFEAIDTMTGGKMAVKILRISPKVNKREIIAEIETMCSLRHKNIIHYFYAEDASASGGSTGAAPGGALLESVTMSGQGATKPAVAVMDIMGGGPATQSALLDDNAPVEAPQTSYLHVFMEYAAGGTLQGKLDKLGRGMTMAEMIPVLRDVVEGVAYVHSQRFVHCDLKTANVLFGIDGRAKLGDFGTARRLAEGEKFYVMQGTPSYMSPECMSADIEDGIGYDFKTDIWSLGMMVLEMATGKPPLSHIPGLNNPMTLTKYITELADAPDLSVLFDAPIPVFELVRACVDVDPEKRPTAAALLDFAFFRDDNSEDLQSAMKALKRAQLLHMLSQFVAFYDPEEEAQKQAAASKSNRKGGADSDDDDESGGFFDSDEDESIGEDAGGSRSINPRSSTSTAAHAAGAPPVGRSVNADAFFSDDDDEDEDVPSTKATPKNATAAAAVPEQDDADDRAPTTLLPLLAPHAPADARSCAPRPLPAGTPPQHSLPSRNFTTAAVALHEALCNFLDRVSQKYDLPVDVAAARGRLKEQYRELQELAKHAGSSTTELPGATQRFEPDGAAILHDDTEMLAKLSNHLDG